MNKLLTYFTPTYNREKLLPNLYNSLLKQTNKQFIWLIIDDGSKDNTEELVQGWIKENKIEIKYQYKGNGGKNTAMDLAHQICTTKFICDIDSDDYLDENSTQVILDNIKKIDDDKIVGLVGRKVNLKAQKKSNWPEGNVRLNFYDLHNKYGFNGETILVFKNDIIKNYRFPEIKDERFITESVFYQQFLYDYDMLTIEESLYFFEYIEDGYTNQGLKLFINNPKGYIYSLKQNAYFAIKLKKSFKNKVALCANYYAWKRVLKVKDINKDYKIPFPYNVFGYLGQILLIGKNKKQFNKLKG